MQALSLPPSLPSSNLFSRRQSLVVLVSLPSPSLHTLFLLFSPLSSLRRSTSPHPSLRPSVPPLYIPRSLLRQDRHTRVLHPALPSTLPPFLPLLDGGSVSIRPASLHGLQIVIPRVGLRTREGINAPPAAGARRVVVRRSVIEGHVLCKDAAD